MNRSFKTTKKWPPQLQALWPALKGSLAKVRKPCIRQHCPACARGDKHPAWMLSFTRRGRRHCLYVPLALVPLLRQAHKNGRRLEDLLYQVGPALLREYRRQRPKSPRRHPPKN
jgi:hypothetical protein